MQRRRREHEHWNGGLAERWLGRRAARLKGGSADGRLGRRVEVLAYSGGEPHPPVGPVRSLGACSFAPHLEGAEWERPQGVQTSNDNPDMKALTSAATRLVVRARACRGEPHHAQGSEQRGGGSALPHIWRAPHDWQWIGTRQTTDL